MWSMINLVSSFPQKFLWQTVTKSFGGRTFHNSFCDKNNNIEKLCRTVSRTMTSIKSTNLELEAQTIEDMVSESLIHPLFFTLYSIGA